MARLVISLIEKPVERDLNLNGVPPSCDEFCNGTLGRKSAGVRKRTDPRCVRAIAAGRDSFGR
jgi:hypothetical protein